MQDLLAGRIDYRCTLATLDLSNSRATTVKSLAIRSQPFAAVAGLRRAEQGLDDFEAIWQAFFMPKGAPAGSSPRSTPRR